MTVIDGDFPREVVGGQNLIVGEYRMPARRNTAEFYDAKDKKPAGKREGTLKLGALEPAAQRGSAFRRGFVTLGALLSTGVVIGLRRQSQRRGRIVAAGRSRAEAHARRKASAMD